MTLKSGRRMAVFLMVLAMLVTLISGQVVSPVLADSAAGPPSIQASVQGWDPTPSASGAMIFTLVIKQGSAIPGTLKIVVPSGFTKSFSQYPSAAGTLNVSYNNKTGTGSVYGGASTRQVNLQVNGQPYDYAYTFAEDTSSNTLTVTAGTGSTGKTVPTVASASDLVIKLSLNPGQITNPSSAGPCTWLVEDGSGNLLTAVSTVVGTVGTSVNGLSAGSVYALTLTNSSTQAGSATGYTFGLTVSQGSTIPQTLSVIYPSGYYASFPAFGSTTSAGTLWVNYHGKTGTGSVINNRQVALSVGSLGTFDYRYTVVNSPSSRTITVTASAPSSGQKAVPTAATSGDVLIGLALNPGIIQSSSGSSGSQLWNVQDGNGNVLFANVPTMISAAPTPPSGGGGGGGGGGAVTPPPTPNPGTVTPGGDNTDYNQAALQNLINVTPQQQQQAELPSTAPAVSPTSTAPVTLTTNDGVQITLPPGAVSNQSAPVQVTVGMGTITTPPKANVAVVVLNPLKYERTFGVKGQAEGTVTFSAPVTISFPVSVADLPTGVTPQQLAIFWWDTARGDWVKLGGVFDATTNTVSVPTYHFSTYAVMADTSTVPNRISGLDRFATANAVADQGWKAGADTVVLANAYAFPDALAAAPLAFKDNAPVLLTDAQTLTSSTLAEMQKLAPKHIILVGGTGVISQGIQDSLSASYGSNNVVRYAGQDRYATAAAIAQALGTTGKAVVFSGADEHFPDALAMSSYAAYNGLPILFTHEDAIPSATAAALAAQKVTSTLVAGGSGAVSDSVLAQLPSATRYGGADRYETASIIASQLHMNLNRVFIVTGLNFPDALVADAFAAHSLSPILMVDQGVPASTLNFLSTNKASIGGLTEIGGEGVISPSQDTILRGALK